MAPPFPRAVVRAMCAHFEAARRRVYRASDVLEEIRDHRDAWRVPATAGSSVILDVLGSAGQLRTVDWKAEHGYPSARRYAWGDPDPFESALSLRTHGYFTHSTAVFLHGLSDDVPQTLYLNVEQSPKRPPSGGLLQSSIDRAFRSPQRASKLAYVHADHRIVVLSGKHTGRYGVTTVSLGALSVPTTTIERTLVDLAVRPTYGGGPHRVLQVYRAALDRVSIPGIVATLDALGHLYPYHQAIGYYLARAGAAESRLAPLRARGLRFDFYLAHAMKDPTYDASWRVHVPKRL